MNFNIEKHHLKKLISLLPSTKIEISYPGDIIPLDSFYCIDYLEEVLKNNIPFKRIAEAGFYGFGNVGMHIDDIYQTGFKTLAIFLKGRGSLQFFESKENYRKKKITDLQVFSGRAVLFDQTLPHSFSLNIKEKSCIAMLIGIE